MMALLLGRVAGRRALDSPGRSPSSMPPLPAAAQPRGCCEGSGHEVAVQQEAPSTSPPRWLRNLPGSTAK